MSELATTETTRLAELEGAIERGLQTFIEVGRALIEIRDERLYRAAFPTFEAYCKGRWGFSARRGRQLMQAAEIGTVVPVTNEAQARELAPIRKDEAKVVEAFQEAKALAKEQGATLSAEHVRYAVEGIGHKKAAEAAFKKGDAETAAKLGFRFKSVPSVRPKSSRRGIQPESIPRALAAHDRAVTASEEIKLVMGPWGADGELPPRRRLAESFTVTTWRRRLEQNGRVAQNGSTPPDLAKVIADLKKIRAARSADADLDEAITALERVYRKQKEAA
jgi:hypothetical protein